MRAVFLLACLCACHGGMHKQGDKQWSVQGHYSTPIVGDLLWWDAKGEAENAGIGVWNRWYLEDRWAIGIGLTPTWFREFGKNFGGAEFEVGMRWHFWEWEKLGIFLDLNGGFLYTSEDVPRAGTDWNFTFALGPGF
ncbi:MAG: hypothetical protein AAGD14_15385, partial [Planctomycetota bacterium]